MTNGNNEILVKESSFHRGVAVPMTLKELEEEMEREKDLINKAKKKITMESSTPKDGISTWILLSGSNTPTTKPEMKPAFRIDSEEKKPIKNVVTTTTTKKRPVSTTPKTTKTTQKYTNNKLVTRVKVTSSNETVEEFTTKAPITTKKAQLTTKAKKYTTARPKTTTTTTTTTTAAPTTAAGVAVIDDDTEESSVVQPLETSTFLIMEAKEADFNLPSDRSPKPTSMPPKKSKTNTTKSKKKKTAVSTTANTRIKKKSDKKTSTKVGSKNPEKPITTQIYNYLAREVMPTVGVGLVGLVVTAGLATYFLGGPLTALRRSYDISNRRDDVAYDRSDDFGGNTQAEEEMFGKVIAGMPENSAYRNNIRIQSYRPKSQQQPAQPYSGYAQYSQQSPKYGGQQHLRYRTIDPYQGSSYQQNREQNQYPQYYQQQIQSQTQQKSQDYGIQAQPQQPAPAQQQPAVQNSPKYTPETPAPKFNIDSVDMTTNTPVEPSYNMDYDDMAQSYYPQEPAQKNEISVEKQNMDTIEPQSQNEVSRSEKITIVQAQSVPSNHRNEIHDQPLPTPEALTAMTHSDEEYQNSIANAIMKQNKQFVVGSVIADHYEEEQPSIVPEHGPRRRREAVKKAAKSLEDNEIEYEREDKAKRDAETSSLKPDEIPVMVETSPEAEAATEVPAETSTQYPSYTYNIEQSTNNIMNLFRRIVDLKLRLGLNFLQNATVAFQHYLKGVEQRVNTSPLFNPYAKNETTTEAPSASESRHGRPVKTL